MSNSPTEDSLSEIIFRHSRSEQLTVELVFAPLLAFLVGLTSPSGLRGAFIM